VQYLPAESNNGVFGDNSKWRGPICMPVNGLLIRSLLNLYQFYGDDFKVECPTGLGKYMTLFEVAKELEHRLSSIFLRDADGKRRFYRGTSKFQDDPHLKDYILFYANSRKHLIVSPMCPQREIGHSLKGAWVLPRRGETRNVVSALEKIGPLVSNFGFRSSTERFRFLAVVLQLSHSNSISSFKVFVSVSECQSQAWVQDWKQIEGEN
jgi:hypothetical protein